MASLISRRNFLAAAGGLAVAPDSVVGLIGPLRRDAQNIDGQTSTRRFDLRPPRPAAAVSPDVVMLTLDDLNDWVGFLGNEVAVTPNLDRLARTSTVFERAYAQVAMCIPSRITTLFGLSPLTSTTHGPNGRHEVDHGICGADGSANATRRPLETCADEIPDRFESMVDTFYMAGYHTVGGGKVYSPKLDRGDGLPYERWNPRFGPRVREAWNDPDLARAAGETVGTVGESKAWWAYVTDPTLAIEHPTYLLGQWAAERLRALLAPPRSQRQPVFATIGFAQPHAPWRIPDGFRRIYDDKAEAIAELVTSFDDASRDLRDVPFVAERRVVKDRHLIAMHLESPDGGERREAATAYLAAVSFVDAAMEPLVDLLVGTTMTTQERLAAYGPAFTHIPTHPFYRERAFRPMPNAERAVVALWSDHGLHLGEKQNWAKGTLWEQGTRIPMLVRDPRPETPLRPGTRYERPVSLLDLYPTMCELAHIEGPDTLEGQPWLAQIDSPAIADDNPAVMTWKRGNLAIRWRHWRLIRYSLGHRAGYAPARTRYYERHAGERDYPRRKLYYELYHLDRDPRERRNLAHPRHYSSRHDVLLRRLSHKLDRYERSVSTWGPRTAVTRDLSRAEIWEQTWT